jgi:hypothetical protein
MGKFFSKTRFAHAWVSCQEQRLAKQESDPRCGGQIFVHEIWRRVILVSGRHWRRRIPRPRENRQEFLRKARNAFSK